MPPVNALPNPRPARTLPSRKRAVDSACRAARTASVPVMRVRHPLSTAVRAQARGEGPPRALVPIMDATAIPPNR